MAICWAVRIALAGFVVPFMADYTPALMLQGGGLVETGYIILKAGFAIGLWGAASIGWFMHRLAWWERLLALVAGVSLILALPATDEVGLGLGALLVVQHLWRARRSALAET